jgi:hypothetical protein
VTVGASAGGQAGGSGSGSGGDGGCRRADGSPVPCSTDLGWWSATYNCYLALVRQAGPEDAAAGHAGEGFFRCDPGAPDMAWGGQLFVWLPAGAAPGPDPAVLAQRAVDSMRLAAPTVGATPLPGPAAVSLIGLPTWLWVQGAGPASFGPLTATASAGGTTVTATARVDRVDWDMGDGTTVTCTGPGTEWTPAMGAADSPDCGHRYTAPGKRTITATARWVVDWSGGGRTGTLALDLSGTRNVDVQQRRAVITG